MESLNRKYKESQLYCCVRRQWVAALPEEKVRQHVLNHLINNLAFPPALIVLEMGLKQMSHINPLAEVPERRADIVCFAKGIHSDHELYPLLLVECKSIKLTSKVLSQVTGYNHFLKACFIAVANGEEIKLGWFDSNLGSYRYIDQIPFYQSLVSSVLQ